MKSVRQTIPADGQPHLLEVGENTGAYGSALGLYNNSSSDLMLGGADMTYEDGWEGFFDGAVIFIDVADKEETYVLNATEVDAEIQVLVFK